MPYCCVCVFIFMFYFSEGVTTGGWKGAAARGEGEGELERGRRSNVQHGRGESVACLRPRATRQVDRETSVQGKAWQEGEVA